MSDENKNLAKFMNLLSEYDFATRAFIRAQDTADLPDAWQRRDDAHDALVTFCTSHLFNGAKDHINGAPITQEFHDTAMTMLNEKDAELEAARADAQHNCELLDRAIVLCMSHEASMPGEQWSPELTAILQERIGEKKP